MPNVQVIITFSDELEKILVDETEMEDISAIQEKAIRDWFLSSGGWDDLEGLIPEIRKMIDDKHAELFFEFRGPMEKKHIFEECIAGLGLQGHAGVSPVQNIAVFIRKLLVFMKTRLNMGICRKRSSRFQSIIISAIKEKKNSSCAPSKGQLT